MEKQYEIIVTPDAEGNLLDTWYYIAFALRVPDIADHYIDRLARDAGTLDHLPYRHELVQDEPWHSRGVRRFLSHAFWIYYVVDEDDSCVRIMNFIMTNRDQVKALVRSMI